MSTSYRLSPYCVFHAAPDAPELMITHSLYGSRFHVSTELFDALTPLLGGASREELVKGDAQGLSEALDTLIQEKVLVTAEELEELGGPGIFANRLDPISLAVQRGFNEGGFLGEASLTGPAPPLRKEVRGVEELTLTLHPPEDDPPDSLFDCLLRRRSLRRYSSSPLPLRALEQFLQHAARMQAVREVPGMGDVGFRAHPSGGGRQPLEIYPIVRHVESLDAGFYHYDALEHRLTRLTDHPEARDALFEAAKFNLGAPPTTSGDPAVLFAITAVVARTCWKYRGIAYPVILQEVGALYQTFYLVATGLRLAPCAIGAFPELAVAELLDVDSRDEAQVGLFALGVPENS